MIIGYVDYDALRKAYASAMKDAQAYIRNNICTGKTAEKDETGN